MIGIVKIEDSIYPLLAIIRNNIFIVDFDKNKIKLAISKANKETIKRNQENV